MVKRRCGKRNGRRRRCGSVSQAASALRDRVEMVRLFANADVKEYFASWFRNICVYPDYTGWKPVICMS